MDSGTNYDKTSLFLNDDMQLIWQKLPGVRVADKNMYHWLRKTKAKAIVYGFSWWTRITAGHASKTQTQPSEVRKGITKEAGFCGQFAWKTWRIWRKHPEGSGGIWNFPDTNHIALEGIASFSWMTTPKLSFHDSAIRLPVIQPSHMFVRQWNVPSPTAPVAMWWTHQA